MAGKAYTMREMRDIVDYLTERRAYGEIKGRKMWTEFANSEKTTRSWQSLKATFLKRILPDIQNPYYKLSMDQVRSFRQGFDVAEKEKNNRLEFRSASEGSNGDSQNENEQSTTRKDNVLPETSCDNEPPTNIDEELRKATGEGKSEKIVSRSRSSADTVVLEYENADELQRVLESPKNADTENYGKPISLKDLIIFEHSAPLTPLVRELLNDFETESEASDKEPQLNIDESPKKTSENGESEPIENKSSKSPKINNDAESLLETLNKDDSAETTLNTTDAETSVPEEPAQKDIQEKNEIQIKKSLTLKKSEKNKVEEHASEHKSSKETLEQKNETSEATPNNISSKVMEIADAGPTDITKLVTADTKSVLKESDADKNKKDCNNTIANTGNSTQNTGNTSSDTLLPNNQEAFDDSKKATQQTVFDKTGQDLEKENEKTGDKSEIDNENNSEKRSTDDSTKQKLLEQKPKESKSNEIPIIEIIDTPTEPAPLEKSTAIPDTNIIEIDTDTHKTNVNNNQFDILLKTMRDNTIKPSTSTEDDDLLKMAVCEEEIVEDKNPCLMSVSLFDEQFKNTKYSDSDSDDEATPAPRQNQSITKSSRLHTDTNSKNERGDKYQNEADKKKRMAIVKNIQKNDGILESSADCEPQRQGMVNKNNNVDSKAINLQREKALANVFGFAHGGATNRKRHISHRRRSHHRRRHHSKNESNSSEWTSESDSESYVSPPRGRRNRQTRKYLKPKSSRILQDPEEGMLYVIFGKKIYPLVKDGKHIKNFLTYRPDSGSDMEEESYWRQKYIQEKRRAGEIKTLLSELHGKNTQTNAPTSSILPSTSGNNTTSHSEQKSVQNGNSKGPAVAPAVVNTAEPKDNRMVLKMTAKDGVEYCLEGEWNQISNAMLQIKMLSETTVQNPNNREMNSQMKRSAQAQPKTEEPMEVSSGVSTPVTVALVIDPEVHERVNKLESEIFKEIEEREKEEQLREKDIESTNVTKRKIGRPRKETSSSSVIETQSPAKRSRMSKPNSTETKQTLTKPTRSRRTSKPKTEVTKEPAKLEKQTTQNKSKTSEQQTDATEQNEATEHKESNVTTRKKEAKTQNKVDQELPQRRSSSRLSKQKDNFENASSVRSTEVSPAGMRSSARLVKTPKKYDTDSSASDVRLRSRKSTSKETAELFGFDENTRFLLPPSPANNKKSPRGQNIRSLLRINFIPPQEKISGNPIDTTQGYQDSDGSPMKLSLIKRKRRASLITQKKFKTRRATRRQSHSSLLQELSSDSNNSIYFVPSRKSQSTLNSKVYRTESFDLLLPKRKKSFNELDRIDETRYDHQFDTDVRHFNSISKESDKLSRENSNIDSSSVISLPLSPELSVVENMSISREVINSQNHPTLNEIQSYVSSHKMDFSEFMISNIDVSIPLMDQQCDLHESSDKPAAKKTAAKCSPYSDPLLSKECTVRIENMTLSETLDQRLRNLLLESSKKTTKKNDNKENTMKVNATKSTTVKKTRTQKYSDMEVDESKATTRKTSLRNEKVDAMEVDESLAAMTDATMKRNLKENATESVVPKITTTKNTRAKKRSSTPQKKKATQKKKPPKDQVIEEEHMESCSIGGRKSCPPVMTYPLVDENANSCADITQMNKKENTRKKKDVIKVKIQRPKSKEKLSELVGTVTASSIYTDSGINDTGTNSEAFLKGGEDSVDLIHNHSETCLLANECMGDSVQFVENSNSVISLSSSEQSVISELQKLLDDAANLSGDFFTNPLDNATAETRPSEKNCDSIESVYQTPAANSSLVTEDLSDELPDSPTLPVKWYLLSEEENTQTSSNWNLGGSGANLNQIFPIACAVPNLSTITEMSKENEDSRKMNFGTDFDSNCDSQNML